LECGDLSPLLPTTYTGLRIFHKAALHRQFGQSAAGPAHSKELPIAPV
jgi:hypothetical protein